MKVQTMKIENGQMVIAESIKVKQDSLASDCWLIQFHGLRACVNCELKNTTECGGGKTLKILRGKNDNR